LTEEERQRRFARLFADRGHGLSRRQKDVLGAVARREVFHQNDPRGYAVWRSPLFTRGVGDSVRSLVRLGLVELGEWMPSGECRWELTRPDGYGLAGRLGLLPVAADVLVRQSVVCDTCGAPEEKWDPNHRLYRPGVGQCPLCVEADIEDDERFERRCDL
jgi:hypothetical protein